MAPDNRRTRIFRLTDDRLLIADLDPAVPPGCSPLQRALRTGGGHLLPVREEGEDGTRTTPPGSGPPDAREPDAAPFDAAGPDAVRPDTAET